MTIQKSGSYNGFTVGQTVKVTQDYSNPATDRERQASWTGRTVIVHGFDRSDSIYPYEVTSNDGGGHFRWVHSVEAVPELYTYRDGRGGRVRIVERGSGQVVGQWLSTPPDVVYSDPGKYGIWSEGNFDAQFRPLEAKCEHCGRGENETEEEQGMSMEQARQKMQGFAVGQKVFLTPEKLDDYGWKFDDVIVIERLDEYDDDLTFKVRNTRTDGTHWVSKVTSDSFSPVKVCETCHQSLPPA